MADPEAMVLPAPRPALAEDDDVARVERWAQRQQAELEHLVAELAELRSAVRRAARSVVDPGPHLRIVDELLRSATERQAARTADAIAAADQLVADAVQAGAELLAAASLPGSRLRPRDPLHGLTLAVRPARPAAELWREVTGDVAHPPARWEPPAHTDGGAP